MPYNVTIITILLLSLSLTDSFLIPMNLVWSLLQIDVLKYYMNNKLYKLFASADFPPL